jgi:hypothetical protein
MRRLATSQLCHPLLAQACAPERNDYGRIKRGKKVQAVFVFARKLRSIGFGRPR